VSLASTACGQRQFGLPCGTKSATIWHLRGRFLLENECTFTHNWIDGWYDPQGSVLPWPRILPRLRFTDKKWDQENWWKWEAQVISCPVKLAFAY
jgi:hypothetical protein